MTDMTVAKTILSQLGGARALGVMTGAYGYAGGDDFLSFRWKVRGRDGIKAVRITLDPSDTYTIRLYTLTGRLVDTLTDVYNDGLVDAIERRTGLALRAPRIRVLQGVAA